MPKSYRIRITPRALADLEGVFDYIRRDSEQNAAGMIRALLDAIDGLAILPQRYGVPRIGRARDRRIRSMPVRPYLVRYRIEEKNATVWILRVRHGARRRS